jgi:hypothetical protein
VLVFDRTNVEVVVPLVIVPKFTLVGEEKVIALSAANELSDKNIKEKKKKKGSL